MEDILYIDSHCPYLLFGETTFHLTSMLKFPIYYLEKPPNEGALFNIAPHIFFLNVGNSIKREENMTWEKNSFFQYFKNS